MSQLSAPLSVNAAIFSLSHPTNTGSSLIKRIPKAARPACAELLADVIKAVVQTPDNRKNWSDCWFSVILCWQNLNEEGTVAASRKLFLTGFPRGTQVSDIVRRQLHVTVINEQSAEILMQNTISLRQFQPNLKKETSRQQFAWCAQKINQHCAMQRHSLRYARSTLQQRPIDARSAVLVPVIGLRRYKSLTPMLNVRSGHFRQALLGDLMASDHSILRT
jgi:hypothetical protein